DQVQQPRRITALADHVETRALKQACQALAQQDIIVSERDPGPLLSHLFDYRRPPANRTPQRRTWPAASRLTAAAGPARAGRCDPVGGFLTSLPAVSLLDADGVLAKGDGVGAAGRRP